MKIINLISGFYSHDDGEYKDFQIKAENRFVKNGEYYLFPIRNKGNEDFHIGFSMNCQYEQTKRELYALNQDIELKEVDEYSFRSYENETYYEEITETAIFETEKEYTESSWKGSYVILEDMEETLGDLLFIKEIDSSGYYTEKFIHNISKIKFSSKFPETLEVYLLNGKYDDYLWYYDEKEKEEAFERIKNEIKELLTEEEFEKTVKETEIDFTILNKKYSLLNQIKAQ